jgi:hypothetical protein
MCEQVKIESEYVSGYVNDMYYISSIGHSLSNHAWNMVNINGKWYLVDATYNAGGLIAKPTIRSQLFGVFSESLKLQKKYRFVASPSMKYFLKDPAYVIDSHLPADPMWQGLECALTLHDRMEGKLTIDECNTNYLDTLSEYQRVHKTDRLYQSGLRAYRFNTKNGSEKANAEIEYGNNFLEKAKLVGSTDTSKSIEYYKNALHYYNLGLNSSVQTRKSLNSEKKQARKYIKAHSKHIQKKFGRITKNNEKYIEKNKTSISKQKESLKKYRLLISKFEKLNYVLQFDDKIYDVKTPKPGATVDMAALNELKASFNDNSNFANSLIDSIRHIEASFRSESAINANNKDELLVQISDSTLFLISKLKSLVSINHYQKDDSVQFLTNYISDRKSNVLQNKNILLSTEKIKGKQSIKALKDYHSQLKKVFKDNKKVLINIKKIKSQSDDEEILYAIENQNIIEINNKLIERYRSEMLVVEKNIEIFEAEIKQYKRENKKIKQLLKIENKVNKQRSVTQNLKYDSYIKISEQNVASLKAQIKSLSSLLKDLLK